MISAIKHVDEVMLYQTEQELYALLRNLKPDVRILGTDWKGQAFTGYDLDIPIHWHNRDHDWSTSELRGGFIALKSEKMFKNLDEKGHASTRDKFRHDLALHLDKALQLVEQGEWGTELKRALSQAAYAHDSMSFAEYKLK